MTKPNTFDDLDCDIHFAKTKVEDLDLTASTNDEFDDDDSPTPPDVIAVLGFDPDMENWEDDEEENKE